VYNAHVTGMGFHGVSMETDSDGVVYCLDSWYFYFLL